MKKKKTVIVFVSFLKKGSLESLKLCMSYIVFLLDSKEHSARCCTEGLLPYFVCCFCLCLVSIIFIKRKKRHIGESIGFGNNHGYISWL